MTVLFINVISRFHCNKNNRKANFGKQHTALFQALSKDNACQNVVAVSTDTTSVISGDHHGSVVKHERKLGKVLLKVWCLEHIVDLSQKKAFKAIFHATKAPSPANGDFKVNHS